ALADLRRREAEARAVVNPLACGVSLHDQTSLPEPVFADWVQEAGLTPPPPNADGLRDWPYWWFTHRPAWEPDQVAHIWKAMDRLRLFEVTERRPGPRMYVLVGPDWDVEEGWVDQGNGTRTLTANGTLLTYCEGGNIARLGCDRGELEAAGELHADGLER